MTTPITRSAFLKTLAGLAAAPYVAARALAAAKAASFQSTADVANDFARQGLSVADTQRQTMEALSSARAIKVPSNRHSFAAYRNADGSITTGYLYKGDWDGTFKLEVCDNPAWMLADLWEREGNLGRFGSGKGFDWHALYDYGQFCDELVVDIETERLNARWMGGAEQTYHWMPRHTVASLTKGFSVVPPSLRDTLSMHYRVWLASDPRYQRSFPGIPYPENRV